MPTLFNYFRYFEVFHFQVNAKIAPGFAEALHYETVCITTHAKYRDFLSCKNRKFAEVFVLYFCLIFA